MSKQLRSDKELVTSILEGDIELFSELVAKYANVLYSIAYGIIGDFHSAQDIVQETFIKAYNKLGQINEYEKTGHWLYVITRRLSLDYLRRNQTVNVQFEESFTLLDEYSLEERMEQRFMREELWGALNALDEQNRITVLLYYIAEKSMKETATILNVSEKAVESRLRRSRRLLKDHLSQQIGITLQQRKMDDRFVQKVMKQLLQKVGGVYIPVSDSNRSVEWFVRHFGLSLSDNGNPQLVSGECLYFLETKEKHPGYEQSEKESNLPILSFAIEQINKIHTRLKQEGVIVGEIVKEVGGKSFFFYDPDKNKFVAFEND